MEIAERKPIDSWDNFGYESDVPCCVCKSKPTKSEPRFGYSVCKEHHRLGPIDINNKRTDGI